MKRVLNRLLSGGLLVLLTATMVFAQATAQISGIVKDSSGGVLPGASVTITQTETGFKRDVVTDVGGAFAFPSIPIGPYRLEVMLQGFRTYVQNGIVLQVNSSPNIAVALALGAVAETITVTGEAPLIDTGKLGVGQVMDNKRILDLPLNGRNAADLMTWLPAVVPQPALDATSRSMGGAQGGKAFSVGGRAVLRRGVRARWRDAQQPVRQPEPAAAVPRRAAGVRSGDQRADREERDAFRRRRQRGDEIGLESVSRRRASSSSGITA